MTLETNDYFKNKLVASVCLSTNYHVIGTIIYVKTNK